MSLNHHGAFKLFVNVLYMFLRTCSRAPLCITVYVYIDFDFVNDQFHVNII